MTVRNWIGQAVATTAALLALAGCASATSGRAGDPGSSSPPPASTPGSPPAAVHCPTTRKLPEPPTDPIPAAFSTAWVLRCDDALRAVPQDGKWWFRVEERSDGSTANLMSALRRPDLPTVPGMACALVAVQVPYFALVDASGQIIYPRLPLDACRQPQRAVADALRDMPFHEVSATRMYQEQSQKSIDSGCGQIWTTMPPVEVLTQDKPAAARPMWHKTPDSLRICVWHDRPNNQPELIATHTVTGSALTALLARLDQLPAARACAAPHHSFAVIEYHRTGWYDSAAYGELDGCRVIARPDHTLGQLDEATIQALSG